MADCKKKLLPGQETGRDQGCGSSNQSGNSVRPQKLKKIKKRLSVFVVFLVTLQFMCLGGLGGNLSICRWILVQQ